MTSVLAHHMPTILRHAGTWVGTYRHVDAAGMLLEEHQSTVRCAFPATGPYAYIQHNHFVWADGREHRAELPGILRDGRLWWDLPTFHGCCWESDDGILLLSLERKDEPGVRFFEMIVLGSTGAHRARTWHWFKHGKLYKRTLCDETRVQDV